MHDHPVSGMCAPEFAGVRKAFAENFTERNELGAAVAVYVDGHLVVNLWGGHTDADRTQPWQENTLASVYSGSKGLLSTCVHQLADRGELDLDAPVAQYWPEFARHGKDQITVAMVLGHRSGVIGPRDPLRWRDVADWESVCAHVADAEPWWEPGTAQGYHVVTFGVILGEVIRRVTGRSAGTYLCTEIADPIGADVHIGLSPFQHQRCAEMINKPSVRSLMSDAGCPTAPRSLDEHPMAGWAVSMNSIPDDELGTRDIATWRSAEFPSTNAHVSALGMATVYNALACEKLFSREHLERVRIPQGGLEPDLVLGARVADHGWGLGYMLNQRGVAGPNRSIFGHGGSGGSYAFVDLEHRIGYAYVMNRFDATKCNADPRSVALSDQVYAALGVRTH